MSETEPFDQGQLVLGFPRRDDTSFSTFYAGPNTALLKYLEAFWQPESDRENLYLWGPAQSGRSHLLHAACKLATQSGFRAFYLALSDWVHDAPADLLDGLESMDLICVDDIDCLTGRGQWQETLFHLYNRLQQFGGRLIFTADCSPHHLDIELADLKSRLAHAVVYQVYPLSDADKQEVFVRRAKHHGMVMSDEVVQYIMNRCERSIGQLLSVLDTLDRRSLQAKRRMTIPFVKEVMEW